MKAAVFTLSTMQPASLGSLPPGTTRPVVSWISIFSAPTG